MATKRRSSLSHISDSDFVEELLKIIEQGKKVLELAAKERIYSQGDQGTAIYFIKHGKVRISVVSVATAQAAQRRMEAAVSRLAGCSMIFP